MNTQAIKSAVVTGGTRGIGLAIAQKLKQQGVDVLVTGTKPQAPSDDFKYHQADFSCEQSTQAFADFLKKMQPDILINNAGINQIDGFNEIKPEDFARVQQVNISAPFALCQAVLPSMQKKGWGRIVNITSLWSLISKAGRASYTASKFALDGMTTALAAEVAPHGVLANCVSPGFIETDLTKESLGEQGMKDIAQTVPMKRMGKPEEVAKFVAWLASDENTYISGQNLVIDGGFSRV